MGGAPKGYNPYVNHWLCMPYTYAPSIFIEGDFVYARHGR
jgi:hypothetical protein